MTKKHDFKEVARDIELQELPSDVYFSFVRMDSIGLAQQGFESPEGATHTDLTLQKRTSRIGTYQLDHGVVMVCNEKGEIYAKKLPLESVKTFQRFMQGFNYKNAADDHQDPWYDGSIYAAHLNGLLDKRIDDALFGEPKKEASALQLTLF